MKLKIATITAIPMTPIRITLVILAFLFLSDLSKSSALELKSFAKLLKSLDFLSKT